MVREQRAIFYLGMLCIAMKVLYDNVLIGEPFCCISASDVA